MAKTLQNDSRQARLVAYQEFNLVDLVAGVSTLKVALPAGSIVLGGGLLVRTAITGSTTFTAAIGDAASASRYLAATTVMSGTFTKFTTEGYFNTSGADVTTTFALTGSAATAGKVMVIVEYITMGVATETQY